MRLPASAATKDKKALTKALGSQEQHDGKDDQQESLNPIFTDFHQKHLHVKMTFDM